MTITVPERTPMGPGGPLALADPASLLFRPPRRARPLRLVPTGPVWPATRPSIPATRRSNSATVPAAPATPPMRLTRRGRLLVTTTTAALIAVIALTAAAQPGHPDHPGRPAQDRLAGSVVVQPGDTLWALAVRADPGADPRATVERIRRLNGMPDSTVRPGQHLQMR